MPICWFWRCNLKPERSITNLWLDPRHLMYESNGDQASSLVQFNTFFHVFACLRLFCIISSTSDLHRILKDESSEWLRRVMSSILAVYVTIVKHESVMRSLGSPDVSSDDFSRTEDTFGKTIDYQTQRPIILCHLHTSQTLYLFLEMSATLCPIINPHIISLSCD